MKLNTQYEKKWKEVNNGIMYYIYLFTIYYLWVCIVYLLGRTRIYKNLNVLKSAELNNFDRKSFKLDSFS